MSTDEHGRRPSWNFTDAIQDVIGHLEDVGDSIWADWDDDEFIRPGGLVVTAHNLLSEFLEDPASLVDPGGLALLSEVESVLAKLKQHWSTAYWDEDGAFAADRASELVASLRFELNLSKTQLIYEATDTSGFWESNLEHVSYALNVRWACDIDSGIEHEAIDSTLVEVWDEMGLQADRSPNPDCGIRMHAARQRKKIQTRTLSSTAETLNLRDQICYEVEIDQYRATPFQIRRVQRVYFGRRQGDKIIKAIVLSRPADVSRPLCGVMHHIASEDSEALAEWLGMDPDSIRRWLEQ